jgi:hypothetical protein
MLRRRALAVLAASVAALGLASPAVAATPPSAAVLAWARPAGPLVASATNAGTYAALLATSNLAPDKYVITLPDGATRPTRVATSLLVGCKAAAPVISTGAGGRWTISVALTCSRTSTSFTASFATALTKAGTPSFGWQVAKGTSPSVTGTLTGPKVNPGPLASVGLSASPTAIVADGSSTSTLTARPQDAFGNPVAATLSTVGSGFVKVDGTPEPATDPSVSSWTGTSATVTAGTRLGSWTGSVKAVSGAASATSAPVTVALTSGPVSSLSAALSYASPLQADGSAAVSATITAKDAQGRKLAHQSVTASTDEPGAGAPTAVVDNGDGTYSTGFTVGTTAGSYTFTARSGAISTTAGYATAALGPDTVTVAVDPTTAVPADGSSTVTATITVKDKLGRGLSGLSPTLTSTEAGAGVSSVTDNGGGSYTATITVGTVAGSYDLTAAVGAVHGGTSYTTSVLPPSSVAVTAVPSTRITANGTSQVTATVTVTDSLGHGIAGQPVSVSTNESGATVSSVTDNGGGSYTATITVGTTAGAYTITAAAGAVSGTAGYTTRAPAIPGVLTRGEAAPYGDYWSSRDGAPILAGSTDNSFRVTWVSPRDVSGATLEFTIPSGVGVVIGRAFSATCQVNGNGIARLSDSAAPGAVVQVAGINCSPGDSVSIDFTARSSTAFVAGQSFPFQTKLEYYVQQQLQTETTTSSFIVEPTGHTLAISVGAKHTGDPYTRTVTVQVLSLDGQLDTSFQGSIDFARARCGEPGLPGDGDLAINPGWTPHQAVDGVATFDVTSPDKGIIPPGNTVVGPTTTDPWLARTTNGDSLAASDSFELGPDGGPFGSTDTCPTRSGF